MDMYEARQNKNKVSRTLPQTEWKVICQFYKKSNCVSLSHNLLQMQLENNASSDDIESMIEEAIDGSEKRLRQYQFVKNVLTTHNIQHARAYYETCNTILNELNRKLKLLDAHKENKRLKAKKRRIKNKIKMYEEEVKKYSEYIQGIDELKLSHENKDIRNAEMNWVENEEIQSINVRVLSNWHLNGKKWKERNEKSGRDLQKGEFLDIERGWTDYINQGWMQGGYERNVLFRILTSINDLMIREHNDAALSGKWIEYEKWILENCKATLYNESCNSLTFFGQEMVDLARNKYMLIKDSSGRVNAVPYLKFKILSELKTRFNVQNED